MKRTELRRHKALTARTGLQSHSTLRRTPIAPVSAKRVRENRARTEALRPLREAQTWCSRCGVTGQPLDCDERLSRARGGSALDPANWNLLCRACHEWKHAHDVEAIAEGYSESQYGVRS